MFFLAFLEKDIKLYCTLREKIFFFEKNSNSKFSFLHKFSQSYDKFKKQNTKEDILNGYSDNKLGFEVNNYPDDDFSKIHEELKADFQENMTRIAYVHNLFKNLLEKKEEKIIMTLLDSYSQDFWAVRPLIDRDTIEEIIEYDRVDVLSQVVRTLFCAKNN